MKLTTDFKRVIAVICVLVTALCLTSCSSGGNADASMYDLSKAMLSSSQKFRDMSYASSDDKDAKKLLKNVSDIDYSKVDKFFISYASNGGKNADEIVVIQLKNKKDAAEAKESLNKHLETRKSLYATYKPSESPKLLKARVITYNNIVCLIVADETDSVEKAFYGYFGK